MTFQIDSLLLGTPLAWVQRILSNMPVHGSGRKGFGIAHIGDLEVTVVDLRYHLFQQSGLEIVDEAKSAEANYMMTVRGSSETLFGIPIAEAPVLVDLPASSLRLLPETYRQLDTLSIASHVAVIPGRGRSRLYIVLVGYRSFRRNGLPELDCKNFLGWDWQDLRSRSAKPGATEPLKQSDCAVLNEPVGR